MVTLLPSTLQQVIPELKFLELVFLSLRLKAVRFKLFDIGIIFTVSTGHLYVKSDVYGFGVVLVEILTGLRALDTNRPSGRHNLVEWIKPYLSDKRKLKNIMDSRLEGKYPSKAAFRIAHLSLKCIESEHKNRPSMNEVVETLERIEASDERPRVPRDPRSRSTHPAPANHRPGQQHLQHRSPLHPRQDEARAYQNSPRR